MCKFGLVVACLICAGQGLPHLALADGVPRAESLLTAREARSLARLLLAANPANTFITSGNSDLRTASRHRRASLPKAQETAQDPLWSASKNVGQWAQEVSAGLGRALTQGPTDNKEDLRVVRAIDRMERDAVRLDLAETDSPQLGKYELALLGSTALASFGAPYVFSSLEVVKVLTASMGAIAAAVGFTSEYTGKVSVSRGKEIAAIALQAAMESETLLAQAERAKAIIPFSVGISAAVAAIAIIAPAIVEYLAEQGLDVGLQVQVFLICPIIAILSASVAVLANQETKQLSNAAIGVGARRFAASEDVGLTWLSATQQISARVENTKVKWRDFAFAVLPAPFIGFLTPAEFEGKAVVAAAVAAAQCAYSLAESEYYLAKAVDSVAIKTRSAAVSDVYANQGARAGSLLPFTSAVCGLFAATTVAAVEFLPLVSSIAGQSLICLSGPALGSVVAAAATVSKAQCDANANAATLAATKLSDNEEPQSPLGPSEDSFDPPDPRLRLFQLVGLTFRSVRNQAKRFLPLVVFDFLENLFNSLGFKRKIGTGLKPASLSNPI